MEKRFEASTRECSLYAEAEADCYGFLTFEIPKAGFVTFKHGGGEMFIKALFVSPEKRRFGNGTELLDYVTEYAKSQNCVVLGLRIPTDQKRCQPGLLFAVANGFVVVRTDESGIYLAKSLEKLPKVTACSN